MKTNSLLTLSALSLLLAAAPAGLSADWVRYKAAPGSSSMKIDGTSTVHDWTVESQMLGGSVEFDPAVSLDKLAAGPVAARATVTIPVRQLKSGKSAMDSIMYDAMKQKEHPRIQYRLTEMTLKEAPKSADAPVVLDTKGELVVAGVTNKVAFPVTMTRPAKDQLQFNGTVTVTMTSFGIQPPAPKVALGAISTGDEVKLTFVWLTDKGAAAEK